MKKVYVIENEIGLVKIGVTKTEKTRFKVLESGCGYKIVKKFETKPISNAYEIETKIKNQFHNYFKQGEWLDSNFESVVNFVNNITPDFKYEKKKKDNIKAMISFTEQIVKYHEITYSFSNITYENFLEHYEYQKKLGGREFCDFKKDYPLISKGVIDDEEFKEYVIDMNLLLNF